MVRPRKIPPDFVPVEWSDTESDQNDDEDEDEDADEDEDELPNSGDELDDIGYPDDEIGADTPLKSLAKEWLLIEMSHNVSKRASDQFW